MAVQVISTTKAPGAVGPYSQAIKAGDFLFASGQIAIDPEKGKVVAGTVVGQAEQCMKNVGAILEEAGLSYDNVVKTRRPCRLVPASKSAIFPKTSSSKSKSSLTAGNKALFLHRRRRYFSQC